MTRAGAEHAHLVTPEAAPPLGGEAPVMMSGNRIRRIVLQQSKRANVGHIGSALSVADILAVLYGGVLRIENPADAERDRFVLSKGHAALALYAALHLSGWLAAEMLDTYSGDGTLLGVHPEHALRRLQQSSRRVFVLVSDAECNEGALWEAVMFAAHHRLAKLVAIVDLNGQQALGYTEDVLSLTPMADRWRAFGWDAHEVDGHDAPTLTRALAGLDTTRPGPPHVILARTVSGKGVSYMERQVKWHYWPMSDEEYRQALAELPED